MHDFFIFIVSKITTYMVPNRSNDGGKYVIHVVLHQLGTHGFANVSDSLDGPEFSDEGVGGRG